jgi:uncharacterized protein with beta-barrel porin domain
VQVTNRGTILTLGHESYGILAQSVGGGGGLGGSGNGDGAGAKSIGVSVGGGGGAAGGGGTVTVTQAGDIWTAGIQSFGIFAQSVGGGGGIGGGGVNNTGGSISVGGAGGAGGNGDTVTVNLTGNVVTSGDGAHAVFAQSVGGGVGGSVSTATVALDLTVTTIETKTISIGVNAMGAGGGAGNGGAAIVNSSGTIMTTGANAYGILAQSIGGGGGLAGQNDGDLLTVKIGGATGGSGTGGAVTVTHSGSIYALGADSHGIFAQSYGPDGNGNITINVTGGEIVGGGVNAAVAGSTGGAGIYIDQGATNVLTLAAGASVSSLAGKAITATGGDDIVNNSGTVTGNVDLGGGVNAFNNLAGGNFITGTAINLGGNANVLTNSGLLEIAGAGTIVTAAMTGTLTQTAAGTLGVDVLFDPAQASDLVNVSGDANISGRIKPNNLYLMPGVPIKILKASGTLTLDPSAAPVNTATITYGLDANNLGGPGALNLTVQSVGFGDSPGMTGNQGSLGGYFQSIWNAGGSTALASAMGYLVNLEPAAYGAALDRLMPTGQLGQVTGVVFSGLNFTSNLMSCHGFAGPFAAIREHQCNWIQLTGGATDQNRTAGNIGYYETSTRLQAGRQIALAPDWFLDVSFGYERAHTKTDAGTVTTADRYGAGLALKHQIGPWLFAAALSGGFADLDVTRDIGFPAAGASASSEPSMWNLDARLRASYLIEKGMWYFKPQVDLDLLYVNMPAFSESGAGALNLNVDAISDVSFAVTPSLEIGTTWSGEGYDMRSFVSLGVTVNSQDSWSMTASMQGAPAGVGTFTSMTETSRAYGNFGAGLEVLSTKKTGGFDLRLQYSTQIADDYFSHTGTAKLAVRF